MNQKINGKTVSLKALIGIVLAVIIVEAVIFGIAIQFQKKQSSIAMEQVATARDKYKASDSTNLKIAQQEKKKREELEKEVAMLVRQLNTKKETYIQIEKAHDEKITKLNTLPDSGQVRLLASWLSEADSAH